LNGKWHGSLSSNRKGEGIEKGNCPWLSESDKNSFGCYEIDVTIYMDLISTKVNLKLDSARSESKGVTLIRDGSNFKIMYLFERNHPNDVPFSGAAILQVEDSGALEGHYWTDREWTSNKQTAGHFDLTKVK
jgi:hypothetical protein